MAALHAAPGGNHSWVVRRACSGSPSSKPNRPSPGGTSGGTSAGPSSGGPSSAASAQAEEGAGYFAQTCARCHGASGEGSVNAPPLIGAGALPTNPPPTRRLRTGTFTSAKDIGMFIKDRMPPGSSTPPERTAAILTFLLRSNGTMSSEPMSPTAAASIPWRR